MKKVAIFIPSRLGSTRLPEKAILDINGKSMIARVLIQAKKSSIADIFVCTDSEKIAKIVENEGGVAVMTESNLPSGSDRIFAAMKKLDKEFEYIINLQGDMPDIDPSIINDVFETLQNNDCDISTCVAEIKNEDEISNPNIVKAVLSIKNTEKNEHRAVYFSRCPVPFNAKNNQGVKYFHHLGIYGYKVASLEKFVNLPESYLEKIESLEQLRAIENDMKIFAKIVNKIPISIDKKEDLERARSILF